MLSSESPQPRLSAYPWDLYRAEHLARRRSDFERDGFYTRLLKEDLRTQRYAFEISLVPLGAELPRASKVLFDLLNDFSHGGYARDPAAVCCDFAGALLEESAGGADLILELHTLSDLENRTKSRGFARPDAPEDEHGSLPTLGFIPNWSVRKMLSGLSQESPVAGQPAVIIPGSRIHRLHLRSPNRGHWAHAVRDLRRVDATNAFGADVDRLSWEGYSLPKVAETRNLAVAATTAPIGWDARGTFSELVTSPYMTFRRLRFVKFWVEAVQDSVAFLSQLTSNESLYGSDAFTFSLSGVPAPQDLAAAMHAIRSGSLTVEKAHNTYLFPKHSKRQSDPPDEN